MDAVEYLKARARMCKASQKSAGACNDCPAYTGVSHCYNLGELGDPEKMVAIVEKWAKEHPVKTQQSKFLEQWPNARMVDNEWLNLCPKSVEQDYEPAESCDLAGCAQCRREFWLAEVDE